jgi:hypothetical protein
VRSVPQTAVQIVSPLVVETYEHTDRRLPRLFQARPAVTANVPVGPYVFVIVPDDENRSLADIDDRNVPRIRYVRRDSDQNPVFVKKDFDIFFEDILAAKEFARQAVPGLTAADQVTV